MSYLSHFTLELVTQCNSLRQITKFICRSSITPKKMCNISVICVHSNDICTLPLTKNNAIIDPSDNVISGNKPSSEMLIS